MAQWPSTLPKPSKDGASLTVGNNTLTRALQSGRLEAVRFGAGAPDKWVLKIRLLPSQLGAFKSFYVIDLNYGTNWFSASWISDELGYADHKGRLLGYPNEEANGGILEDIGYKDITFAILIKPSAACPADITWGE